MVNPVFSGSNFFSVEKLEPLTYDLHMHGQLSPTQLYCINIIWKVDMNTY